MRNGLVLQPIHTSSADILKCFAMGKPLSWDQLNFIDWHQRQLSNTLYDPILNYYLESRKQHRRNKTSFLLPHEEITNENIQLLKKRLHVTLQNNSHHAVVSLTQKQFLQFKEYTLNDLIFWHGNQFLTGAPFYPGGIPPVIYFQWGNLFGIVKYVVLPGEKILRSNILIYFEDMQDRNINKCIEDYTHQLQDDIKLQDEIVSKKEIAQPVNEYQYKAPTLKFSNYFLIDHISE